MFAKLSPDGRKAAYVFKNNIYAEDLASGRVTQLTSTAARRSSTARPIGSTRRNSASATASAGARTAPPSPSGSSTRRGVPVFTMINNTDSLYPATTSFKHPEPGQPNSAVRAGVVPVAGGPIVWMEDAG